MPQKPPRDEFEDRFEAGLDILGMCDASTARVVPPGEVHPAAKAKPAARKGSGNRGKSLRPDGKVVKRQKARKSRIHA